MGLGSCIAAGLMCLGCLTVKFKHKITAQWYSTTSAAMPAETGALPSHANGHSVSSAANFVGGPAARVVTSEVLYQVLSAAQGADLQGYTINAMVAGCNV